MNILSALFALSCAVPESNVLPAPAEAVVLEMPANLYSYMVSEDYAEISWDIVSAAAAYRIEIRMLSRTPMLVLEDKTVWTSFYFRVAEPDQAYEYRLAALTELGQSAWTPWTPLHTNFSEAPAVAHNK